MRLSYRAALVASGIVSVATAFADITGPTPLAWRWAEPTTIAPGGTPQFDGDNVFIASGGRIYCLEKATGNLKWRYPAGEAIAGAFTFGCVLSHGKVIAAANEKSLFAVDAKTGELAWQHINADAITTNVVVSGEYAAFGSGNSKLMSVSIQDGKPAWSVTVADGLHPTIQAAPDGVVFSTARGRLVNYNGGAGRANWEQKFSRLSVRGSFTVQGERIYVNSGSFLVCLRAGTGGSLWQQPIPATLDYAPVATEEFVASTSTDGKMFLYTSSGRQVSGKPVELGSSPSANAVATGKFILAPTSNGAINLVDTGSASVVWSYVVPALVTRVASNNAGSGGVGGAAGLGGGDSGGGALGAGAGGAAGGAGGAQASNPGVIINYTTVSGNLAVDGTSLMALTRDGSLLMFDPKLGVDLTAPSVAMLWPRAGTDIAGKAPMEILFKVDDLGIGVNPDTVKVSINGKEYISKYSNDGYLSILVITGGANPQLQNGKAKVTVSAVDWLGNATKAEFTLTVDNTLPPLGGPPRGGTNTNNPTGSGPGGGGRSGGGRAGGGGLGGGGLGGG